MSVLATAVEAAEDRFSTAAQADLQPTYFFAGDRLNLRLVFPEGLFPVRLSFERPFTDEEVLQFSAIHDALRFEQEPNGDITLRSPPGLEGGEQSPTSPSIWEFGRAQMVVAGPSTPIRHSVFPTALCGCRMQPGCPGPS